MASKIVYKGGTHIETVSGDELKVILPTKGSYHQWPIWWDTKDNNVKYKRFAIIEAIVPSGNKIRMVMPVRDGGQSMEIYYDGIGNFLWPGQRPLDHAAVYTVDGNTLFRTYDFRGTRKDPVKTKVYQAYTNAFLTDNNAPIFKRATVNENGKNIAIEYDEELTALAASAKVNFKVTVGVADQEIIDLFVQRHLIYIALKNPIAKGATVKLSYTKPSSGDVTAVRDDAAVNNEAANLTNATVINNSKNDGVAPKIQSFAIGNDGKTGVLSFSEEMNKDISSALFTFRAGGVLYGFEKFDFKSPDDKTIIFTLNKAIPKDAQVTIEYTQKGNRTDVYPAQDLSEVEMLAGTITGINSSSIDQTAPTLVKAEVAEYSDQVFLIYNEKLDQDSNKLPPKDLFEVSVKRNNQENKAVGLNSVDYRDDTSIYLAYENPIAYPGDEVYVTYKAPTSGSKGLQDTSGNLAKALDKVKAVNNSKIDVIAPTIKQAIISPDGKRMFVTLDEKGDNRTVRASDFVITRDSTTFQPTSAAVNADVLTLNFASTPILKGAVVKLAYVDTTPNDSGDDVVDEAGNKLSRFASVDVINNSTRVDTTAPKLATASVNAAGNKILADFDQDLPGTPFVLTFVVSVGGVDLVGGWTSGIAQTTGNASQLEIGLTNTIKQNEIVRLKYVKPTSLGDSIRDVDGNQAASFDVQITNNSSISGVQPVYQSSVVPANGDAVNITYDIGLRPSDMPPADKFTIKADNVVIPVIAMFLLNDNKTIRLVTQEFIEKSQSVTVDYADPTSGDDVKAIQSAAGVDAAALSNKTVLNNSEVPRYHTAATDFDGRALSIVYLDALNTTKLLEKGQWSITAKAAGQSTTSTLKIKSIEFLSSLVLSVKFESDSIIGKGDTVTLNYTHAVKSTHRLCAAGNDGAMARNLKAVSVTNNSDQDALVAHYGAAQDVFTDLNFAKDKSLAHRRIADVFSYTSTSPSYYINSNGFLQKTKGNYVRNSNDFNIDNFTSLIGVTVSPNEMAGPGFPHVYCQSIKEQPINADHKITIDIPSGIEPGTSYIVSFYVRPQQTATTCVVKVDASQICNGSFEYDLKADAFKAGATGTTAVSSHYLWRLVSVRGVATAHSGTRQLVIALGNGTAYSYTGTNAGCIDLYGLQINEGATIISPPVVTGSLPGYEPRFTHHPKTKESMGLLLEQSTFNLMSSGQNGNSFPQWTTTNLTASHNSSDFADPTGNNKATKYQEASNTDEKKVSFQLFMVAKKYYAFSMFVKTTGREYLRLSLPASNFTGSGTQECTWDITGKRVVATSGTFSAAKIEEYRDGWYRISCRIYQPKNTNQSFTADLRLLNSSGANAQGKAMYFWGVQWEENKYDASTYIETTRSEDKLTIPKHEIARTNLFKQSQKFKHNTSGSSWLGSSDCTSTTGTTADFEDADGGRNATRLEWTTNNNNGEFVVQAVNVKEKTDYVLSFYIRNDPNAPSAFPTGLNFYFRGQGFVANMYPLVTPLGDWHRVSMLCTTPDLPNIGGSQTQGVLFGIASTTVGKCMIYGAQLEEGRFLTPYAPSNDSLSGPNDKDYISMRPDKTTYRVEINKNDDEIWEIHTAVPNENPSVIWIDDDENIGNTHVKLGQVDIDIASGNQFVTKLGWESQNKGTMGWSSDPAIPTQHNTRDDYLIMVATVKAGNSQIWSNDQRYAAETTSNIPELDDITFQPTQQPLGRITIYKDAITDAAILKKISNPV